MLRGKGCQSSAVCSVASLGGRYSHKGQGKRLWTAGNKPLADGSDLKSCLPYVINSDERFL
jgi:hypothetical protein